MSVVCGGRLTIYPPRGEYQLIIDAVEPRGLGILQKAFEQLKVRLEAEGLFASVRKKSLPFLPARIGVVTSPTGAVIRDILTVTRRRFLDQHPDRPGPRPGRGARDHPGLGDLGCPGIDVIIPPGRIAEDLAFNDEVPARLPLAGHVISVIGHGLTSPSPIYRGPPGRTGGGRTCRPLRGAPGDDRDNPAA
jgi:exodeoxyribonuclease VII large subunit